MSSPISVRLADKTAKALDELSKATDRTKTYFIEKALESHLAEHADYGSRSTDSWTRTTPSLPPRRTAAGAATPVPPLPAGEGRGEGRSSSVP